jgi:predicted RNase H-like HicB family nuclease
MRHEFTAVYERDDEWVIAYCPEVPGANGQGRTKEEARASLTEAIVLILEDRREEGLRGVSAGAEREVITVDVQAARNGAPGSAISGATDGAEARGQRALPLA